MSQSDPDAVPPNGDARIEPVLGAPLADDEVLVTQRGPSFAGNPQQRWAWMLGVGVTVAFLGIIGYSYMYAKPNLDKASLETARAKGTGAVTDPTPRQRELVVEENRLAAEAAMKDPRGVEVPPYIAASERVPPPPPPPASYPVQMQRQPQAPQTGSSVDYITKLASSAEAVRGATRLPLGHVTAFANQTMQPAVQEVASAGAAGGLFPVGEYLMARLDMGVNSDFANQVTAVILRPDAYRGIRLVGRFDQPNDRFARSRVALRFTEAYPNPFGEPISINAVAVDPGSRVPALRGKVQYHILENVVFHLGGAFVQGYAQGLATSDLTTLSTDGGSFAVSSNLDPGLMGAARAAQALASPRGIRPPTVQIPAGTSIGVVVLSQQEDNRVQPQPGSTPAATDPVFVNAPLPTFMAQ